MNQHMPALCASYYGLTVAMQVDNARSGSSTHSRPRAARSRWERLEKELEEEEVAKKQKRQSEPIKRRQRKVKFNERPSTVRVPRGQESDADSVKSGVSSGSEFGDREEYALTL